jgi:hypothetical protein
MKSSISLLQSQIGDTFKPSGHRGAAVVGGEDHDWVLDLE